MSKFCLLFVILIYDSLQQPTTYQYSQSSLTTLSENETTIASSSTTTRSTQPQFTGHQYYSNSLKPTDLKSIPKFNLFPNGSYEFEYSTADQSRKESSDVNGNVSGHYSYKNKDFVHEVQYVANANVGFSPVNYYYMIRPETTGNEKSKYSSKYQLIENVEPFEVQEKYFTNNQVSVPTTVLATSTSADNLQPQFGLRQQTRYPFNGKKSQTFVKKSKNTDSKQHRHQQLGQQQVELQLDQQFVQESSLPQPQPQPQQEQPESHQNVLLTSKTEQPKIFYAENPLESNIDIQEFFSHHYNPSIYYTIHI